MSIFTNIGLKELHAQKKRCYDFLAESVFYLKRFLLQTNTPCRWYSGLLRSSAGVHITQQLVHVGAVQFSKLNHFTCKISSKSSSRKTQLRSDADAISKQTKCLSLRQNHMTCLANEQALPIPQRHRREVSKLPASLAIPSGHVWDCQALGVDQRYYY